MDIKNLCFRCVCEIVFEVRSVGQETQWKRCTLHLGNMSLRGQDG